MLAIKLLEIVLVAFYVSSITANTYHLESVQQNIPNEKNTSLQSNEVGNGYRQLPPLPLHPNSGKFN